MTDTRILAELYVLGALDDAEHDAVARRIEMPATDEDKLLARAVASFGETMHEVDLSSSPASLSDGAWARLDAALDDKSSPDDEPQPAPASLDDARNMRSARGWRGVALGAIAASILMALGLVWQASTATPLVMAILLDDTGRSVAVVEVFDDDSARITPLVPIAPGAAQVLQVWTKPDPDGPPVSLGILEQAIRAELSGPDLPLPDIDQLYEITVEPEGGSPTGLPTGPIVGKGLAQPTF